MDLNVRIPADGLPCAGSDLLGALMPTAADRRPLPRFAVARAIVDTLAGLSGPANHELRVFELPTPMPAAGSTLPAGRYLGWRSSGVDDALDTDQLSALLEDRLGAAGAPSDAVTRPAHDRRSAAWADAGRHHLIDLSATDNASGPGRALTVQFVCGGSEPGAPLTVAGVRDMAIGLVPAWVPARIALAMGGSPLLSVAVRENGLNGWTAEIGGAEDGWRARLEDGLVASGYAMTTEEIAQVEDAAVIGSVLRLERAGQLLAVTLGVMRAGGPIELRITRQR